MLPYIVLLLIPSLFALFNARTISLPLWIFAYIYFVLFVGLRQDVGPDWPQYGIIHSMMPDYSFWDIILQPEPLSHLLFWISEGLGFHVYLSNMVAAIIMMTGVFAFARRTSSPWLALLAATPYFIIVMGMSGIRQSMAAGILLFLLSRWERYNFTKRGVYILIAAMFHTSALVNNIFLATKLNIATRYKIIIGVVILIITFYLSSEVSMYAGNVTKYKERYLAGSFVIQSVGSLYHIAMIVIPAILGFIYKKRILPYIHNSSLLNFGLYASMVVLALDAVSSTVASRLTIYLYFLPMMIYPALLNMASRKSRLTFMFFILSFHLIVMIGWFSLGNVAFAYLPYKNVLFDE